jgi:catechol 2,3-dioxygenase-like lactoylglutathione lyase family enzyme
MLDHIILTVSDVERSLAFYEAALKPLRILRNGAAISEAFTTTEKDRVQAPSKLHEFLEDLGLSRVDAHMICTAIEEGNSISGVFAPK